MTSLVASLIGIALMVGVIVRFAHRRAPGTPLTWGEAFVGALFLFGLMLLVYGIMPSYWLTYADGTLKWRSDKIGIPLGPLRYLPGVPGPPHTGKVLWFIPVANNSLWPHGITFFGRGKIVLTKQVLRDVIAALIYVVALGGQIAGWAWWQKRGKRKVERPELTTSAYGRPLVRKA